MAMPPTLARAPDDTGTVTTRPETVPDTEANGDAFEDGDVGLPPHPVTAPIARRPAALLQHAQNSRRVGIETSSSLITAVTS
jgi:hypothetical protein